MHLAMFGFRVARTAAHAASGVVEVLVFSAEGL